VSVRAPVPVPGTITVRRMSAVLSRVAKHLRGSEQSLAVTKQKRDPFRVLVACLISLRTKDEVTDVAAPRLLAVAPTPAKLAKTPVRRIEKLIFPAGFYRTKARVLRALGETLVSEHDSRVPDTIDGLVALHGVGRKTANLVVTLGYGKPGICVDVHVHRISNRLGFVRTRSPNETETALRRRLPRRWWLDVNDLLVAFGRSICTPVSPWCSRCPVRGLCLRVGVGRTR
jgi:endonuclease-3